MSIAELVRQEDVGARETATDSPAPDTELDPNAANDGYSQELDDHSTEGSLGGQDGIADSEENYAGSLNGASDRDEQPIDVVEPKAEVEQPQTSTVEDKTVVEPKAVEPVQPKAEVDEASPGNRTDNDEVVPVTNEVVVPEVDGEVASNIGRTAIDVEDDQSTDLQSVEDTETEVVVPDVVEQPGDLVQPVETTDLEETTEEPEDLVEPTEDTEPGDIAEPVEPTEPAEVEPTKAVDSEEGDVEPVGEGGDVLEGRKDTEDLVHPKDSGEPALADKMGQIATSDESASKDQRSEGAPEDEEREHGILQFLTKIFGVAEERGEVEATLAKDGSRQYKSKDENDGSKPMILHCGTIEQAREHLDKLLERGDFMFLDKILYWLHGEDPQEAYQQEVEHYKWLLSL